MSQAGDLFDRRLILVLGKGGVGRTTVATALALASSRRGRRTLLFQANARDALDELLGGPKVGETLTPITDLLSAVNTNPNAALHQYGLMVLHYERVYRLVLENRVARSLIRAIPGLDDYSIMGKLWWHTTERLPSGAPRWDTIVFDAPATGHALAMLEIPRAILETVPEGPLTRDARSVGRLLSDPAATAAVIVTLAEEMPVNEAIELHAGIEGHVTAGRLVVNQVYPDRFPAGSAPGRVLRALDGADAPELSSLLGAARTIRGRRELNEEHLARLRARVHTPEVQLPLLTSPTLGAQEIAALADILDAQLRSGAAENQKI